MRAFSRRLVWLLALVWMSCSKSYTAPPQHATHNPNGAPAQEYAVNTAADASGAAPAPASGGGYAQKRGRWGGRSASPSVAEERAESRTARPKERPGLGTSFGERRTSQVQEAPFTRASYDPFAVVSLFYNDAEGVAAQTAYQGGADPIPLYAYTPAGGIAISLRDEWGRVLEGATAGGRTYIVGQDGARYSLVLQNNTGGRFEIVASVDGLDVIDGSAADPQKRGYLLEPYGTLTIDGFRTSDSTVAAFRFGAVSDSYAAKSSGDRNVGVIGVAFFAEQGSAWTSDELHRRESADPFPGDRRYAQPPRY